MNSCHCYHIVHSVIVQPLNFKEFYFGSIKVTFCGSSLSSRAVVDKIQCQPSGFYTTKVVYFLLQYYMILKFVPVDFTLIKFACNLNRSLIFTPTLTVHRQHIIGHRISPHTSMQRDISDISISPSSTWLYQLFWWKLYDLCSSGRSERCNWCCFSLKTNVNFHSIFTSSVTQVTSWDSQKMPYNDENGRKKLPLCWTTYLYYTFKKKIDFTCSARIKKLSSRATIGFTLTLCLHFIPQQRPFCPSLYL